MNEQLMDWIEEDGHERVMEQLDKWRKEAEKSYDEHPNLEQRHCSRCGELMRANSMAYLEGYHFDSCF